MDEIIYLTKNGVNLGPTSRCSGFSFDRTLNELGGGSIGLLSIRNGEFYQDMVFRDFNGADIVVDGKTFSFFMEIPKSTIKGDFVKSSGKLIDEFRYLQWRNGYPDPANVVGAWTAESDDIVDFSSNVIKEYCRRNFGASALTPRQFPGVTISADDNVGKTIDGSMRNKILLPILQGYALNGADIEGNDVVMIWDDNELTIREIIDSGIVLSYENKNIANLIWTGGGVDSNFVIGMGRGQAVAREFVPASDSLSIMNEGRRELPVDFRNVADVAGALQQAADSRLLELNRPVGAVARITETPDFQLFRDLDVGYTVTITDGIQSLFAVVRQIKINKATPSSKTTKDIIVGAAGQKADDGKSKLRGKIRSQNDRTSNLERNT